MTKKVLLLSLLLCGFLHLNLCQKCTHEDLNVYDCTNLSLSDLPSDKLENAVKLDLSHNLLTKLKNDTFLDRDLTNLGILYMHDNKITTIEVNAFRGLVDLDFLNLNNNDIVDISPNVFKSNLKLRFLRFENNTHLQLPHDGFNLPELNVLDLERCGLETIPRNFFENMKDLEILYLRGNRLSYLDPELIKPLHELEFLDLRENLFTKLQLDILRLPLIFKLSYVGNPFQCDCSLLRAYSLYKKKAQYEDLSCKNDDDMIKTDLSKLANQLDCNSSSTPTTPNPKTSKIPDQDTSTPSPEDLSAQDTNTDESYDANETEPTSSESWIQANQVGVIITSIIILMLVITAVVFIIIKRKKVTSYLISASNRFTILKNDESHDNDSFDGIHNL